MAENKICGIDLKGNDAVVALVDRETREHCDVKTKKIPLGDSEQSENVKAFKSVIEGFLVDNEIDTVVIKKRAKTGRFSGGSDTFKMEAVIQLIDDIEITLVSPQTIAAMVKKHKIETPATLKKYQHDAFLAACTIIS